MFVCCLLLYQDDIRRKKLALERVNVSRAQIGEKLSDVNLQLNNAEKEQKRVVVKKQAMFHSLVLLSVRPSVRHTLVSCLNG